MQDTVKNKAALALVAAMALSTLAACTQPQSKTECTQPQGATNGEFSCDVPNMRATVENPM